MSVLVQCGKATQKDKKQRGPRRRDFCLPQEDASFRPRNLARRLLFIFPAGFFRRIILYARWARLLDKFTFHLSP